MLYREKIKNEKVCTSNGCTEVTGSVTLGEPLLRRSYSVRYVSRYLSHFTASFYTLASTYDQLIPLTLCTTVKITHGGIQKNFDSTVLSIE